MADTHIKIKPVTPRVQYTANGSTTVFPYSFAIFDETDMVVYVDDDVITTGYTVSGAGQTDGGNVTFATAPADGTIITLLRNVPIERMTDFQEGGTFRPKNLNDEFDRQTAFAQQVQEKLERAVVVGPTSDVDPEVVLNEVEGIYENLGAILNAKTWAEGTDEEVQAIGGTHSAEGWAKQASDNYSVTATGTTASRLLKDRFSDNVNVRDFGAVGDGTEDDTTAIQKMITEKGYARFPTGKFLCSTTTLDAPLFFDVGGALKVNSGNTVTITGDIESTNQHTLTGDGDYVFDRDTDSGQNSSQIHISWFGVFPDLHKGQSSGIQKALNSISSRTEGVVDFDVGTYRLDSTITVPRGVWIRGQGIRRTAFTNYGSDITLFQTGDVACRFSDIQFENEDNSVIRNNPQIHIKHANCDIFDVVVGRSNKNIVVDANLCRIDRVVYVFNVSGTTGSSVISVNGGNNKIQNVSGLSIMTYGPEAIVRVDGGYANTIENISDDSPSIGVLVSATTENITNTAIVGVRSNAANVESNVKAISDNGYYIKDIAVLDVITTTATTALSFESKSLINNLRIDDAELGTSTTGIELKNSGGTFSNVFIGANISFDSVTTPYNITGTISNLNYGLSTSSGLIGAQNITVADDGVYVLDLDENLFQRFFYLCQGVANYYFGVVRAASSPNQTTISKSANVDIVTTALTGTTGTDGNLTIGLQQKKVYIENRLGAAKSITFGFLGGIF